LLLAPRFVHTYRPRFLHFAFALPVPLPPLLVPRIALRTATRVSFTFPLYVCVRSSLRFCVYARSLRYTSRHSHLVHTRAPFLRFFLRVCADFAFLTVVSVVRDPGYRLHLRRSPDFALVLRVPHCLHCVAHALSVSVFFARSFTVQIYVADLPRRVFICVHAFLAHVSRSRNSFAPRVLRAFAFNTFTVCRLLPFRSRVHAHICVLERCRTAFVTRTFALPHSLPHVHARALRLITCRTFPLCARCALLRCVVSSLPFTLLRLRSRAHFLVCAFAFTFTHALSLQLARVSRLRWIVSCGCAGAIARFARTFTYAPHKFVWFFVCVLHFTRFLRRVSLALGLRVLLTCLRLPFYVYLVIWFLLLPHTFGLYRCLPLGCVRSRISLFTLSCTGCMDTASYTFFPAVACTSARCALRSCRVL